MRTLLPVLLFATLLHAQDTTSDPMKIVLEPLGDTAGGVATRVTIVWTAVADQSAGELTLSGSIETAGAATRTFRRPLAPTESQRTTFVEVFPPGQVKIFARIHASDRGGTPLLLARAETTAQIVSPGHEYVASAEDGVGGMLAEGFVPETAGAVRIQPPRRDLAPNLYNVAVSVKPPVRRVEFWIGDRKIITRNAPPYVAELDLGVIPRKVEIRAIGYDSRGRYVDADAFLVSERSNPLDVKVIRTETQGGLSQIRVALQNPSGVPVQKVELYADDRLLTRWAAPPYALALGNAQLEGVRFLRATAVNADGVEASDLLFLDGTSYVEAIEVNLVELPVTVTAASGGSVLDLTQADFVVKDAGRQVEISRFDLAANLPLTVGVLVDHSGSMKGRIDDARQAAIGFFRTVLTGRDRAFFGGFSWDSSSISPIVSDAGSLQLQVGSMPEAEGATALYDAVVSGLYRFKGVEGRKALIIVSDGEDTASRTDYESTLRYARSARVPIYVIGIGLSSIGTGRIRGLAAETGGNVYFIRDVKQLESTYQELERELRTQYVLGYYSDGGKEGEYRQVEVTVPGRKDLRIRTIRGYIP